MLSKILFFSVCLTSLFAFIVATDTAQDNPGKCLNPIDGKEYNPGESWVSQGGECLKYTCEGPGSVGCVTCPLVQVVHGFKLTEQDDSKPFPECCPQVVVDEDVGGLTSLLSLIRKLLSSE